jgi:pyrroloquinoline quinone (PQQ) biosynthesis protein C
MSTRAQDYGVSAKRRIAKAQALLHEIGASYEDVDNHIDMIVQEHCAGLDEFAWEIDEVTQYLNEPVETE